jgi:hypothetical protein
MKKLRQLGCEFDKSCGLHINLNDYLKINKAGSIPTAKLDFLFNFVAPSRRQSNYCNHFGISTNAKYSMIYIQNDRLEFRFFSPTLDPEKLNHYVRLAHTVYKRLCGVDTKLPKKTMNYLLDKMVNVNGVDKKVAMDSIKKVNSLKSYLELSDINNNVPF